MKDILTIKLKCLVDSATIELLTTLVCHSQSHWEIDNQVLWVQARSKFGILIYSTLCFKEWRAAYNVGASCSSEWKVYDVRASCCSERKATCDVEPMRLPLVTLGIYSLLFVFCRLILVSLYFFFLPINYCTWVPQENVKNNVSKLAIFIAPRNWLGAVLLDSAYVMLTCVVRMFSIQETLCHERKEDDVTRLSWFCGYL